MEGGWLLTRRPKAMIELLNLAHPQIRYFHRYFREVVDNSWGLSACKMKCPVCYGVLPKEVWTKVSMKESVCVGADRRLWEKVISQTNKQTNQPTGTSYNSMRTRRLFSGSSHSTGPSSLSRGIAALVARRSLSPPNPPSPRRRKGELLPQSSFFHFFFFFFACVFENSSPFWL